MQCSKEGRKYDKNKFIKFLSNEDNLRNLYESAENVVIRREVAYMRGILMNASKLNENIEVIYELIEHDLTRIYRVRNKLVHSENNQLFNMDIFTIRLNKYINALIGTLIYHLKRQPNLHISEVLNSIHETYEWYINFLKKGAPKRLEKSGDLEGRILEDINNVAFPPYLYL